MFFQLLYIHLYRPFLKYNRTTSPLPAHVSPRKYCTQGAAAISKLFRLYKRTHGLRQICNIAIYIVHSSCTIHLLNLPDKNARRDIIHGVKHLEEMGECWTAARRTLRVVHLCADRWNIEMPEEAEMVYTRIRVKWGITPGAPSPVSPESLANMAHQITSQPIPDIMARNVQQNQSNGLRPTSIAQYATGLSAAMAPSPAETVDSRRTSSGFSLPPTSAAEFSRDSQRIRPSTYLTKAQQDAWNAHQSRLAANTVANSNRMPGTTERNAAKMFGGVDSLMEETQDWIFKDQNQFAMGFENWGSEPPDWGTLDLSFFDTADGTGSSGNTSGNSPAYASGLQYSYDPTNATSAGVVGSGDGGYGAVGYAGNGYPAANMKTNMTSMNRNNGMNSSMNPGMVSGVGLNGNGSMGAAMGNTNMARGGMGVKRSSQNLGFDDEVYY